MNKHIIQIPASDGCVYVYDMDTRLLKKICEVRFSDTVPEEVLETLQMAGLAIAVKR